MRLQLSPDAPLALQALAATALVVHVGGAFVGIASGGVAMVAPKGGRVHRLAGNVFFVAMLCMAGVGAVVAPFMRADQLANTVAGTFTCYMVASGWMAVRRPAGQTGGFEIAAAAFAFLPAVLAATMTWLNAESGHPLGQPQGTVINLFATFAALAGVADILVIRRGRISGPPRIARHLWRMSMGLIVAAASLAGQPKAIPVFLRGSPLLFLPVLATLIAMIWWLVRTRRRPRAKPAVAAA